MSRHGLDCRCGRCRLARDLRPVAWYGDRPVFDVLALVLPVCLLAYFVLTIL